MDLKTQRRIAQFKAKERAKKKSNNDGPLTEAERQRRLKAKSAAKKRPGFGSSCPSVADHLNEVVGLTQHVASKREERDKRIEAAAKSGAGCRRFEVAAIRSGAVKFQGQGQSLARGQSLGGSSHAPASIALSKPKPSVSSSMQAGSRPKDQRMMNARAAFLARFEHAQEEEHATSNNDEEEHSSQ